MQIVRDLAGYSYGRSDLVRRAMAKKKHKVMEEERQIFVHGLTDDSGKVTVPGCVRRGVPESVANEIYDEMIAFASYAFNKSHAAAYGVVAMQTAWLKCHYPVPFLAAMLNSVFGNTGKIAGYVQYCRGRDIPVLPPDINRSRWKFTVDRDPSGKPAILFGLGAVKSVGTSAVNAVIRERETGGPFRDLFDFCRRIDTAECGKRVTESLIRVGAFDHLGANRPQMLAVYESALDASQSQKKKNVSGQVSLFDLFSGEEEAQPLFAAEMTLPPLPDCTPAARLKMEKEAAGVYMTGHPLDQYREILMSFAFSAAMLTEPEEGSDPARLDGRNADLGGIVTAAKEKVTKKGDIMAFVTLEDLTGPLECLVFPRVYEKYRPLLSEDAAVVISGKISVREDEPPKLLAERVTRLEDWKGPSGSPQAESGTPRAPAAAAPPGMTGEDALLAEQAEGKLFLRLDRGCLDAAMARLSLHAGPVPVYLHFPAERRTLLCPRKDWVTPSEDLLSSLRDLLGETSVVLKKKAKG